MTNVPKIRIENLCKSFGSKAILQGINIVLHPKESLAIIGGSGTGKSVFFKCIFGLLQPDQGNIWLNGLEVTRLSSHAWQKQVQNFGMLFQGGALFDSMSVWENVAFTLIHGKQMGRARAQEIALAKIAEVNLSPEVAKLYPEALSGGMKKRVALARAIAADPEVIFFDEPTTGLDPIVSSVINELILKCVKTTGASAVTITHDINSVRQIADRVALLYQGRFIWIGSVKEMDTTDNPYVRQFIHGQAHGPFTD